MKFKVFNNAKKLQKFLKNTGETSHSEYWEMQFGEETINITLKKTESGTQIDCTCKHCSIHGQRYICSYKAALIYRKSK